MKSGVPNRIATKMADEWSASLTEDTGDLDPRIAEIEAANLAKHYHRWHVERLGTMTNPRPDGVFRILGGQLNSASSAEVRSRKVKDVVSLINEWEVQAGYLSEVGVNWSSYPSSANLASLVPRRNTGHQDAHSSQQTRECSTPSARRNSHIRLQGTSKIHQRAHNGQ